MFQYQFQNNYQEQAHEHHNHQAEDAHTHYVKGYSSLDVSHKHEFRFAALIDDPIGD